jgi:histidinol-phosphate aminotransferase
MRKLQDLIRPDLLGVKPYSSARDEFEGDASIFLDANENPFDNEVNRYPDPLQKKLKTKIATLKNVQEDSIFLGNGSDECIDLLFRLFCIPFKDEISAIAPSYGMYGVSAKINGVKLNQILLNDDFSLNVEEILKVSRNSKLLFLCSPNNPTGKSFPQKQLIYLIKNFDGIVVIDEAYSDFSEEKSFIQFISEYKNLVITQTFSKAYGMAGIRLGMLFANSEIIEFLNRIKPPYNINILTQNFALNQLENHDKILKNIELIKIEREKLLLSLEEINSIEKVFLSDSNFILIKIKNADEVYKQLISKGIVVRNRSKELLCESCLRITVGTEEENEKLIYELKKELNN